MLLWGGLALPCGVVFGWNHPEHWVIGSAGDGSLPSSCRSAFPIYFIARRRSADYYLALRRTLLEAGVDRSSTLETAKVGDLPAAARSDRIAAAGRDRPHAQRAALRGHGREPRRAASAETAEIESTLSAAAGRHPGRRGTRSFSRPTPSTLPCSANWKAGMPPTPPRLRETMPGRPWPPARSSTSTNGTRWPSGWTSGLAAFVEAVQTIRGNCERLFPEWNATDSTSWTPPEKTLRWPSASAKSRYR